MEALQKGRRPLRRQVTKLCNELDAALAVEVIDKVLIEVKLQMLHDNNQKLMELDNQIMNQLVGVVEADNPDAEGQEEREFDSIQDYQEKVKFIQVIAERALAPRPGSPTQSEHSTVVSGRSSPGENRKTFKLPKIELPKFDGDLKNWLGWWRQFEKIDSDPRLHSGDKFQYLLQATQDKSEPREIISVFPPTGENYPIAIEELKRRYGREGLQLQVYLRELLNLVIANVSNKEKIPLDKLYWKLESSLRALNTLDLSKAEPSMYFYPLVESCLPEDVLRTCLRAPASIEQGGKQNSKLDSLMNFIKKEVEGEQQITLAKNSFQEKKDSTPREPKKKKSSDDNPMTAATLYTAEPKSQKCVFCAKTNHASPECYKAKRMTYEEKAIKVKAGNACLKCSKYGHHARNCKWNVKCPDCDKIHAKVMCPGKIAPVEDVTDSLTATVSSQPNTAAMKISEKLVLRGTIKVKVMGVNNKVKFARLLIDTGSDISYITEKLATDLKLKPIGCKMFSTEVFGGGSKVCERKEYLVQIQGINGGKEDLKLYSQGRICGDCSPVPSGPWIKELLKFNITLTDISSDSLEIDMLIGSNHMGALLTGKMLKIGDGIVALETKVGWYVNGEVTIPKTQTFASRSIALMTKTQEIAALWELDILGIKDSGEKVEQATHDLKVKEDFQNNLQRNQDGRYVVSLPWISESLPLPHNKEVAVKRLQAATNKLVIKNEFENYDAIFRAWEAEGIIEEQEDSVEGHFLPHRPVFKPESLTTPVRPVFDASCRVKDNPSLNQCLEKGPNMLEIILSILLRFRKEKVGVISDIRKAFQMVEVQAQGRKFQRFLWWKDYGKGVMKILQHCRVVFGLNCSPFMLAAVIEAHLKNVIEVEKETSKELLKSLYVDNCVTSFSTRLAYHKFKDEATAILLRAKMDLTEWESNVDEVMEREVTSVLGYKWNKKNDTMFCDVPRNWAQDKPAVISKRSVLSLASQIFDPIGVTAPAILQLKLLLREAWAQELKWDDPWEEEAKSRVLNFVNEMNYLEELKIPRCAIGDYKSIQLHIFTDASKDAFAAIVFARIVEELEEVKVQLLIARSRVAPLHNNPESKRKGKAMTIPRLELMGCFLGARLAATVKKSMDLEEVPTVFWSDSTIALAWIRRDEDWGTFVGNRVRDVLKISKKEEWRHVPGKVNPADLPSRGCSPSQLLVSKWWEGPGWLLEQEDKWPKSQEDQIDEDQIKQEKLKSCIVKMAKVELEVWSGKYASYQKNVRVVAYAIRILKGNYKGLRDPIKIQELRRAETIVVKIVQERYFPDVKKIQPRVEMMEDGLLHVRTKLEYKEDTAGFRYPVLLPNNCPLIHELIREVHRMCGHGGIQVTLNLLREKYWILKGRRTVTLALRKCVTCRRQDSRPLQVNPVALPEKRVTPGEVFTTTGVDLAGPLFLKDKKKVWIVLYTCAVYRCVALDLVESLSTEAFVNSLERFVTTYGRPNTIYSDNGTNFVGAQNLFKRLNWIQIEKRTQIKQIQWIFNPLTAAWWGGWWERLVRSVKDLLKRMLGKASLTREELATCISAAAATINERPLTSATEDVNDLAPLTPAMFLKGTRMTRFPESEKITGKDLRGRHKVVMRLKEDLQARFRKEYLAELVQRASEKKTENPKVGDVVLVGADNKKRCEWPLGRILKLNPGKDGEPRSALVKVKNGVLSRPLQRLYPLEILSGIEDIPKIQVTEDMVPLDDDHDVEDQVEVSLALPEVITRVGRKVVKPRRYGTFSCVVQCYESESA